MATKTTPEYTVQGIPLGESGLDRVFVRYPDGHLEQLGGIMVPQGWSFYDVLEEWSASNPDLQLVHIG